MTVLAVFLGSALGASARRIVDHSVTRLAGGRFPWGTLVINVSGSLILGVVLGLSARTTSATALWWTVLLGTGFCGGFTTFSTFAFETVRLSEENRSRGAVTNVAMSVVFGLAAVAAGWQLATTALH
jgi:fluoride exporter